MDGDPLCLFYYPCPDTSESYIPSTKDKTYPKPQSLKRQLKRKERKYAKLASSSSDAPDDERLKLDTKRKWQQSQKTGKYRIRNKSRQPSRHLPSRLLASVQCVKDTKSETIPALTKVLHTITEAWSHPNKSDDENSEKEEPVTGISRNLLERRRSVPEEIIRKFTVTEPKTSESETHATMPEFTSPSSKENEVITQTSKPVLEKTEKMKSTAFSGRVDKYYWPPSTKSESFQVVKDDSRDKVRSGEDGSSDSDSDTLSRFNTIKRAPLRRGTVVESSQEQPNQTFSDRALQCDYQRNGKGVISIKSKEKSSQTGANHESEETISPRGEETETAETSDTISSPKPCAKPLSSSENLSTDSESIRCTCTEIQSSKETSTDPNHSGKSTLSQTVSDKSLSTQDTTASVNSVSSRGSTITAATDSSSTELDPRTSAKETTSPDHTPRPLPRIRHPDNDRGGAGGNGGRGSRDRSNYPQDHQQKRTSSKGSQTPSNTNTTQHGTKAGVIPETSDLCRKHSPVESASSSPYKWTQLSKEELWLIQEQRQKRFLENERKFSSPLTHNMTAPQEYLAVGTNTTNFYSLREENIGLPTMVPRYSALPRTMSMVVNSDRSFEQSNSDSDCPSLDSLEDGNNLIEERSVDTKQERKPVRGHLMEKQNKQFHHKEPRGRAYFFSISESGDTELVTNIHKIPEMPEEIKKKLDERHMIMCEKRTKHTEESTKEKLNPEITTNKLRRRLVKRKPKINVPGENTPSTGRTPPTTRVSEISSNMKTDTKKAPSNLKLLRKSKEPSTTKADCNNKSSKYGVSARKGKPELARKPQVTDMKENKTMPLNNVQRTMLNESRLNDLASASCSSEKMVQTTAESESKPPSRKIDFDVFEKERQSLIASLEATAAAMKVQPPPVQWNRQQPPPKPSSKFHQRFEVIPEERSSSLTSSADELLSGKDRRRSLPVKLTDTSTSPTFLTAREGKSFRRYSLGSLSNYVIAKLMGKPLQAIPCVQRGPNNENQQIIIFSPKEPPGSNSSKGRDALLAMNREDFNRLSKGWMNFYLLKESSNSEDEQEVNEKDEKVEGEKKEPSETASNTIVCRIPTMKKDPQTTSGTASGTGTDECSASPPLPPSTRRYSLQQLTDSQTNLYKLEEYTPHQQPDFNKFLDHISEEPEQQPTTTSTVQEICKDQETSTQNTTEEIRKVQAVLQNRQESQPTMEKEAPKNKLPSHQINSLIPLSTELPEPYKLNCSNTVLQSRKKCSSPKKTFSLPELNNDKTIPRRSPKKSQSLVEQLPQIPGASSDSQLTDSDSTGYLNIPSPQLPRLPIEDCDCYSSDSSSSDDLDIPVKTVREKSYVPIKRRPLPFRPKNRFTYQGGRKTGWSVTVEGTLEFPRTRPDVQMRLSFPQQDTPPFVNQSDSGFAEERVGSKPKRSAAVQKPHWTVTVNQPSQEGRPEKLKKHSLPNLNQQRQENRSKRGFKEAEQSQRKELHLKQHLSSIWPKIQGVLEKELELLAWDSIDRNAKSPTAPEDALPLSVEGRAVPMETKPRATKISSRTGTNSTRSNSQPIL